MVLMAKERMEDAVRSAEQMRALRRERAPRRSARVLLGTALVRFGHWIVGQPSPSPGDAIGLRQAQS